LIEKSGIESEPFPPFFDHNYFNGIEKFNKLMKSINSEAQSKAIATMAKMLPILPFETANHVVLKIDEFVTKEGMNEKSALPHLKSYHNEIRSQNLDFNNLNLDPNKKQALLSSPFHIDLIKNQFEDLKSNVNRIYSRIQNMQEIANNSYFPLYDSTVPTKKETFDE
jgi:hypothetical protein